MHELMPFPQFVLTIENWSRKNWRKSIYKIKISKRSDSSWRFCLFFSFFSRVQF